MVIRSWIIVIGNEILVGRILDTNSNWIAKKLTAMGIRVDRIVTIPDDENVIVDVVREACKESEVVICTGGLGPTYDDKTSEALAKALNRRWIVNREALEMVKERLKKFNLELNEYRIKMAKMPEGATPLRNDVGVAPGIHIKCDNTRIFALPGVPAEMKSIFVNQVENILRNLAGSKFYREDKIRVRGFPESGIAPIIEELVDKYPTVYIKSHPLGIIDGELTIDIVVASHGDDPKSIEKLNKRVLNELMEKLNRLRKT